MPLSKDPTTPTFLPLITLMLLFFPMPHLQEPSPDISPEDVMLCLMRGLKYNDIPEPNSGLERCFNFADNMCRAAIGGDGGKTGSHVVTLENFIKYAQNPTFSTMTNCKGESNRAPHDWGAWASASCLSSRRGVDESVQRLPTLN